MLSFPNSSESRKKTVIYTLLAALFMGILIWVVDFFKVPNPNMILISALVVFTSLGGLIPGAVSSVMMILYSMYFFSEDHSFFRYSELNSQKILIVLLGVVMCFVCVGVLQWARRRDQLRLQKQNEGLTTLMRYMPGMAFLKNAETGIYIACNQNFAEYAHRKSPDEVVGLTDHEIFDMMTARHFVEDDRKTLAMDKPYNFYEDVPDAAGKTVRNLQTTKLKYTDENGKPFVLGMSVDISEVLRMRQEAQEVRDAYEQARSESVTYGAIARALASDYDYLYYVDLKTEDFIEYSTAPSSDDLLHDIRKETDFFAATRRDAASALFPADRDRFVQAFTKENLLRLLDEQGTFVLNYRLMEDGRPVYVSLKASRMPEDPNHVIIGVSNIDAQVRTEEEAERIREERITYARITALAGSYICIYTVDPETDHFLEYSATADYAGLGLAREGDNFFELSRANAKDVLFPEDLGRFMALFTRKTVLREIRKNGLFTLQYRLMIEEKPTYVSLKAALVQEKDKEQLIIGINNIDAQVQRDQEYESNLEEARQQASRDALTGVKNKHAWDEALARLDREIAEGKNPQFGLIMFDLNWLKEVNDSRGHQAGDEYLKAASAIICNLFKHSPVFRIGGDEFALIVRGQDNENAEQLLEQLMAINRKNEAEGGPTIAAGLARYNGEADTDAVFARADAIMYENKASLKSGGCPPVLKGK